MPQQSRASDTMCTGPLRSLQAASATQAPATITAPTAPRYVTSGRSQPWGYGHWIIATPSVMPSSSRAQTATRSPRLAPLAESTIARDRRGVTGCRPGAPLRDAAESWALWGPEFASCASRRSTSRAIGSGWRPGGDFGMLDRGVWDRTEGRHLAYRSAARAATARPTADYRAG